MLYKTVLKILLIVQLSLYAVTFFILPIAVHTDVGLVVALLIDLMYTIALALGALNIVLSAVYFILIATKKSQPDRLVYILIGLTALSLFLNQYFLQMFSR